MNNDCVNREIKIFMNIFLQNLQEKRRWFADATVCLPADAHRLNACRSDVGKVLSFRECSRISKDHVEKTAAVDSDADELGESGRERLRFIVW